MNISINPSANNFPVGCHRHWFFTSAVDNIFRTITAFCAYHENVGLFLFLCFPHSLFFEQQRWHKQIFLQICICNFAGFWDNFSNLFFKYFQFLTDVPKSLSSIICSLNYCTNILYALGSSWKLQVCWFFWLAAYLGIRSDTANNQGQAATHSRLLMWISFLYPAAVFCFQCCRGLTFKVSSSVKIWR